MKSSTVALACVRGPLIVLAVMSIASAHDNFVAAGLLSTVPVVLRLATLCGKEVPGGSLRQEIRVESPVLKCGLDVVVQVREHDSAGARVPTMERAPG